MSNAELEPAPSNSIPVALWIVGGLAMLVISIFTGFVFFAPAEPPPPGVAGDPFLMEGRGVFLSRCATCHGASGRGNGPMSGGFRGGRAADLAAGDWKRGDKPEEVLATIRDGVPNTVMAAWGPLLEDAQIRAVAGYCYALAERPVPEELRRDEADSR